MIVQDIVLRTLPWHVRVYYAVDRYYADEIIDDLISLGCKGNNLTAAKHHLWRGDLNTGLTYADTDHKEAVMVIGLTTSGEQFYNSMIHETLHLLSYIAKAEDLNPYGEKICYLAGELAQKTYKKAKRLMCDCCRKKMHR